MSVETLQMTPLFILHFPEIGSGGAILIYGGSSKNVIFRWNFSGTPCGGVWEFPGHTISFMSSPAFCQDFHTPICNVSDGKTIIKSALKILAYYPMIMNDILKSSSNL